MNIEEIKAKYNKELATLDERKRSLSQQATQLSMKLGLDFSTLTKEQLEEKIKTLTSEAEESEKKLQEYIDAYESEASKQG